MRMSLICLLFFATYAAAAVHAEPCSPLTGEPKSKSCIQVHTFNSDELMAMHNLQPRAPNLNDDVPWIAQVGVAPPVEVKPSESGAAMRTSLGQWRDFNTQVLARRIDEAKAMTKSLPMPKAPMIAPSPFEVWTSVDVQGLASAGENSVKTGMGADYKLTKSMMVGIAVERADVRPVTGAASLDDKLAARMTFQPTSLVSIEAKTQHEAGTTGTSRIDNNSISIAPKLKYPFAIGSGQTLEPFLTVKDELIRGTTPDMIDGTKRAMSAGTGVTFAKPGSYTMSVTADAENLGAAEAANYKSRFQLSVPLK